jgi:hypothetical protein
MTELPPQFDVFISYAHDDDNRLMDEPEGWVTQFHKDFDTLLNEELGRRPNTWRDSDLTPNEDFEKKIFNRLARSAVFLPIFSKIFINRPYCLRELKAFVENAGQQQNANTGDDHGEKTRVFVVEKTPVERQQYPTELFRLAGTFKFYEDGKQTLRPALSSRESRAREAYYTVLNRLSKTIAELIKLMEKKAPAMAPRLPVYIAETTWDLEDQRAALCDDLRDRGFLVLPEKELPRNVRKYSEAVAADLQRASISVHLVGSEYGFIPEGEQERSHVRLQHDLALAQSDKDSRFTQIVWLPSDHAPADERQRKFIDYINNDERANSHAEMLEGDIETLKSELYDKLERLRSPADGSNEGAGAGADAEGAVSGPPLVYIICHKADRAADHLKLLRKLLFERGCEPKLAPDDGSEEEIAKGHIERLAQCDAALIYCGAASESWLDDRLFEFAAHLRARKTPIKAKALYLAPPYEEDVFTHEAAILKSDGTFNPETFEAFLNAVGRARRK